MGRHAAVYLGLLASGLLLAGCTPSPIYKDGQPQAPREAYDEARPAKGQILTGFASYYGPGFAGRPTANGETFNPEELTAAHQTLPFNTVLKVTLVSTGKSIVVRINDRGPFAKDRILDLSVEAARRIGMTDQGVGYVEAEVLEVGS